MMRLNRYLAQAGVASRRKCDELILQGRVTVNGEKVAELGVRVDEIQDKITFDSSPSFVTNRSPVVS